MKKAMFLLIVMMILFITVSPASAGKGNPGRQRCVIYELPVRIIAIEPDDKKIQVNFMCCEDDPFGGGTCYDAWLFVTERTRITFADGGQATFDDLLAGQYIDYSIKWMDIFDYEGIAREITIYPD